MNDALKKLADESLGQLKGTITKKLAAAKRHVALCKLQLQNAEADLRSEIATDKATQTVIKKLGALLKETFPAPRPLTAAEKKAQATMRRLYQKQGIGGPIGMYRHASQAKLRKKPTVRKEKP